MINKHLPGAHDQKKHGRELAGPPSSRSVIDGLVEKYGVPNSSNTLSAASGGFSASIMEHREEGNFILGTAINNVVDPDEAENYIDDFLDLSRKAGYGRAMITGLPIDTAIKHNAAYRLTPASTGILVMHSFKLLNEKYDLDIPDEIANATQGVKLRVLMDYFTKSIDPYISTTDGTAKYIPRVLNGIYSIPVRDLTSVQHPLYPDVPLYTELLDEQDKTAYIKLT